MVGSWPRPPALVQALARKQRGQLSPQDFGTVADSAVLGALRAQETAGVDMVTDGEQRRDNFSSFVADRLDGVRLTSLADMLDVVEDKASFQRLLDTLDVPAFSIRNPTCVGNWRDESRPQDGGHRGGGGHAPIIRARSTNQAKAWLSSSANASVSLYIMKVPVARPFVPLMAS